MKSKPEKDWWVSILSIGSLFLHQHAKVILVETYFNRHEEWNRRAHSTHFNTVATIDMSYNSVYFLMVSWCVYRNKSCRLFYHSSRNVYQLQFIKSLKQCWSNRMFLHFLVMLPVGLSTFHQDPKSGNDSDKPHKFLFRKWGKCNSNLIVSYWHPIPQQLWIWSTLKCWEMPARHGGRIKQGIIALSQDPGLIPPPSPKLHGTLFMFSQGKQTVWRDFCVIGRI